MSALSLHSSHTVATRAPSTHADNAPGLFSRMVDALQRAQMRRAERRIATFIQMRGGRLTDTLERQIERHFV